MLDLSGSSDPDNEQTGRPPFQAAGESGHIFNRAGNPRNLICKGFSVDHIIGFTKSPTGESFDDGYILYGPRRKDLVYTHEGTVLEALRESFYPRWSTGTTKHLSREYSTLFEHVARQISGLNDDLEVNNLPANILDFLFCGKPLEDHIPDLLEWQNTNTTFQFMEGLCMVGYMFQYS